VNRITDERLREIAAGKPIPLAVSAATGDPSWAEVRQIAAALLGARNSLQRLRAIEAAARNLEDEHAEPDGLWVTVLILAKHWNELQAALAAKEAP